MKPMPEECTNLSRCWKQWTEIVRLFAEKRVRHGEISQETYQAIHSGLQQELDDSAVIAAVDSSVLSSMKDLSAPWIGIEALKHADTPILRNLTARCDAVQVQWSARPKAPGKIATGILMVAIFLGVFALVLGQETLMETYDLLFDGSKGKVSQWWMALQKNRSYAQSWILGGTLLAGTALISWFVFRPPKSY